MVQTRQQTGSVSDTPATSPAPPSASRKRPLVATHVEIIVPKKPRRTQEIGTENETEAHVVAAESSNAENTTLSVAVTSTTIRSRHFKFGDDDPSVPSSATLTQEPHWLPRKDPSLETPREEEHNEDDDDEAPEAESLSVALTKARAHTRGVARAVERQQAVARQKRRIRDRRLQEQKNRSAAAKPAALSGTNDGGDSAPIHNAAPATDELGLIRTELPDLLPDDILAAEPFVRPPTPPRRGQSSRRHIHFASQRGPKDLQRGGVRVRVLETNNPRLPPKVSKTGRSVRESWLKGRLGRGGVPTFERPKVGGGFLRR